MTADRQWRAWTICASIYAALTIVYAWPLIGQFATHLPADLGDPALNSWILWWNARAVPLTDAWWNAPMFAPLSGAFALSETLLGAWPIATPVQWLGGGPVAAYNAVFVLSYPAAALAAHALAHRLTGRHDAALLAGLAFGFHPYRAAQLPHLQMLLTCWMPLGLLALHRYLDTRRVSALVLLAIAWLLNGLSNGYLLVFFAVLVGLWIAWFVRSIRDLAAIGATAVVASLPFLPIVTMYRHVQSDLGMTRSMAEIEMFSADLSAIWASSDRLLAKYFTLAPRVEGELYPGLVVLVLVMIGVWSAWPSGDRRTLPRVRLGLLVFGLVTALVAFWSWQSGGIRLTLFGADISMTRPFRIVTTAVWAFAIAALLDRRLFHGWQRRSVLLFYVVAGTVLFALALGPIARVFGERFFFRAPYWWLMELPGGNSLRVPARFAMPMMLCLTQAAALAFARLTPRGASLALTTLLAALLAIDGLPLPMSVVAAPAALQLPGADPRARVLELPTLDLYDDTAALLRATAHGHALINGYSGYEPPHYFMLRNLLKNFDTAALEALQQSGPLVVVLDATRDPEGAWRSRLEQFAGARRIREAAGRVVYDLPARPPAAAGPPGPALTIRGLSATENPETTALMVDDDVSTRWEDPADGPHAAVTVAMDRPVDLARLELRLGQWMTDYPRRLQVEVASGDAPPRIVWRGETSGLALLASLRDWRTMPLAIDLPAGTTGDRLILTLLQGDSVLSWSIAELRVFGR